MRALISPAQDADSSMATLYLVRHGQASFGTDDYDRLSDLGWQQARWLGEYFREQGLAFDKVVCGSLLRHRQTLQGIEQGLGVTHAPVVHAGLNEYDSERLWRAHHGDLPPLGQTAPEQRREHFRKLREALYAWAGGQLLPDDHLSFADFAQGAVDGLQAAMHGVERGAVLVVSSGGPISAITARLLQAPDTIFVNLNLQTRNTGVAEFAFKGASCSLVSWNAVPHLEFGGRSQYKTHS